MEEVTVGNGSRSSDRLKEREWWVSPIDEIAVFGWLPQSLRLPYTLRHEAFH